MGGETIALAEELGHEVVAKVDKKEGYLNDFSLFDGKADVAIDFSSPSFTEELIRFALERKLPLVVATTGQSEYELGLIKKASEDIPIFLSPNLSLGLAQTIKAAKNIISAFPDADVEIVERHHAQKADSPSGTALFIAKKLSRRAVYGRVGKKKRGEIGISSVRCGNIVGAHEIIAAFGDEVITLRHEAQSRRVFALGALAAAEKIVNERNGLFDVFSLIDEDKIL